MTAAACAWCGRALPPQSRGLYAARFCSPQHRTALHTAARRYALALLDAGFITATTLKESPACRSDRHSATPRRRPAAGRD